MKRLLRLAIAVPLFTGANMSAAEPPARQSVGQIERLDPALNSIVAPDARIERLADGFQWSEGPVWIADGGYLLFSDVPANRIYLWSEDEGLSVFREPSGHAAGR